MTTRRILAESFRTTALTMLTACTKCRRKWLEDEITPKCVWCDGANTMTITVGDTIWT